MRTVAAALLSTCLVHYCQASFLSSNCVPLPPDEQCRRIPRRIPEALIDVFEGNCSETSHVSCETLTPARSAFKEAIIDWWSEGNMVCDKSARSVAAKTVAKEIAKVWTSFAVNVQCTEGQGFACGWSFADGDTIAASVAEEVTQAAANASLALEAAGDQEGAAVVDAVCFTDIRAMAGIMATAAATAAKDACGFSGGDPVSRYTDSFAAAIETVVEDALYYSIATFCATDGWDYGECPDRSSPPPDTRTRPCVGPVLPCSGIVADKCCTDKPRRVCRVPGQDCPKCRSAYMRSKKGGIVLFRSRKGELCLCESN